VDGLKEPSSYEKENDQQIFEEIEDAGSGRCNAVFSLET
jgi:hypothetical protein